MAKGPRSGHYNFGSEECMGQVRMGGRIEDERWEVGRSRGGGVGLRKRSHYHELD